MAQTYKVLVFDWDGTLFDSTAIIVNALQHAFTRLALPVPEVDQCRHVIGLGLTDAVRHLAPGMPAEQIPELVQHYRQHYLAHDQAVTLFPGVAQGLRAYAEQGYLLAVATGKSRLGLDRALAVSGLAELFCITRCADETFSKPHPQMLLDILDFCDVAGRDALMVGDTSHDMQLAANAGTDAAAVSYGAHSVETLEAFAPRVIAHSFAEFGAWLQNS